MVATFIVDVVDVEAVKESIEGTVERFGKLDIVIANAGTATKPQATRKLMNSKLRVSIEPHLT